VNECKVGEFGITAAQPHPNLSARSAQPLPENIARVATKKYGLMKKNAKIFGQFKKKQYLCTIFRGLGSVSAFCSV